MKRTLLSVLCLLGLAAVGAQAEEITSKNNSKIRKFYNLYPGADANVDKVLTTSEMQEFLMKKIDSADTSANSNHLARFLKNAPESDLDKDGILKKSEIINYLGKI